MVTKYQRKKKKVEPIVHYENRENNASSIIQAVMAFAFILVLFIFWITL